MLTKSKFMNGEQCHRLLWFADRKRMPDLSLSDMHRFEEGHVFERYAYELFPKGVDLSGLSFKENIERTRELIEKKETIFEAGATFGEYFIRADILEYNDGWNLYEIKSSTQVKDQHITDLAFQRFVLEKTGVKIERCFVLYLNKEYVKEGEIDVKQLVKKEEVSANVFLIDDIEERAKICLKVIKEEFEPAVNISVNCNKPYPCPLKEHCRGLLPAHNVLHLTNWRQYWNFFHSGIVDIKDIPEDSKLHPKDQVIREAVLKERFVCNKEKIKEFLDSLKYPLYHFDFETFDTAVPIYDRSKPYQKIPFQYSLHVEDNDLKHYEFLAIGDEDPRIGLLKQLKEDIEGEGSVVVFNKSFEISVLKGLAQDFPENEDWIEGVIERVVDLAYPFQNFYYYSPCQKGSYSIKKVLPAITGKGYENLEINNGGDASILYFNSHIRKREDVSDKLRKNLLNYCCLDTEGMVWIVDELKKLV